MKMLDKIVKYFFERKIKVRNFKEVKCSDTGYYNAVIYTKLPLMKKHIVWSTYTKDIDEAYDKIDKAYVNKIFVKDEMTLVSYIDRLWSYLKDGWLNIVDIINDDDVIEKSKGVFKKPVKKWYWGFGINKRVFKPYDNDSINPILYINSWSLSWKPKYDYVSFEDNPQVWFCLFKFFWFGYILVSPVEDEFEDYYWEQMIWYVNYSDCDLKKAEKTYFSEWDKKYLIEDEL